MARLRITDDISIDDSEIEESFILASGPGGQNVNKVASAVQLRFDAAHSPSLSDAIRTRLAALAGRRLTKDGVLVIEARRHRSQEQNRSDARERLIGLIARAAVAPTPRKATRVPRAAKKKRLEVKKARGRMKRLRSRPEFE